MADIRLKMSSNMASTGRKQLGQEDIARFLPETSFLQ